jgi:hypothetical protein
MFEMADRGEGGDLGTLLPPLPQEKPGQGGEGLGGPILPVPPEIRPTLVKYRWLIKI